MMSLVDEFNLITLDVIRDYVSVGREEDLHLDFKLVGDPNLTRDDRRTFATALSGFSNSDGGMVVWGIDARPNSAGVDCAVALQEVPDAPLCLTRLNTLTGQLVSPVVDGILHRTILSSGTSGFLVSLVPSSESGPHMAKGGEDRYFKRSGSGFYRMEHFDLEDMFGRRKRPLLSLNLRLVPRAGDDPHEDLHFSLKNSGRAVARYSGFFCRFGTGVTLDGVRGHLENVSSLNPGSPSVCYQDNSGVVHPNGIASSAGHAILQRDAKGAPLVLEVSLYCENMQVRSNSVQVTPSEVVSV